MVSARTDETGETVEIRFYLDREGDYEKAEYEIGYIQMEGKGEVTDSEGVRLVNREVRPLAEVPELDRENPVRQIFTLFYRSTSARRSELKFFVRDNFGQERELTMTFDTENGMVDYKIRMVGHPAVLCSINFDCMAVI